MLVCAAADPDLLPEIRRAAAVVTQEGGVTSHGSVLCREFGVPTLVGVADVLTFLRDGDLVEVNATQGFVRLISGDLRQRPEGLIVPVDLWDRPDCVGQKAANLQQAAGHGFEVPPFTLLSFDATMRLLEENEETLRAQVLDLVGALGPMVTGVPQFLLRSSALDEDSSSGSRAGAYVSVQISTTSDVVAAIREFLARNSSLGYRGVIILQRFLPAKVCGVSVDGDPRTGAPEGLIVEFVRGPFNSVTQGQIKPERIVYDWKRDEVRPEMSQGMAESLLGEIPIGRLVVWLSSVSRVFGRPCYTEWGFTDG